MRPNDLFVRCYAERKGIHWQAFCIDFSLGAQGDSLAEVKAKLEAQIREYVFDALCGEDREHSEYLFARRAPLRFRLRYEYIRVLCGLVRRLAKLAASHGASRRLREGSHVPFREPVPLVPAYAHC